jgi:N-acetylglucosamine-6-phosphate deacetylase
MKRTIIENSLVWQNDTFIHDHSIIMENGTVTSIIPSTEIIHKDVDYMIDGRGNYAIPGFVDVHIHGSNGFDTMDSTQEALQGMCDYLVTQGVTSVLPTTMSDTGERISDALNALSEFASRPQTPYIGVHLEGPYLNSDYRGSQPDTHLRTSQRNEYLKWFASGQVRLITIAPELENGDQLIKDARDHNITVTLGHSGATYEQANHAFEVGLGQITHTFNGMRGIHHREPGAFVAGTEKPNVTFQIIPDGVHVHPAMVNMLIKLVGTKRVVVITDAMRAAGLADGHYQLGDVEVTVTDGEARTSAGGLAGSTLTMPNALHNMMRFCQLSLADVVPMLTQVPAQSIGMYPQKGSLAIGSDADIVLWDSKMGVQTTILGGEVVYQASSG